MPGKGLGRWLASDTAIRGAGGQANIRPQDAGPASAPQHCFPCARHVLCTSTPPSFPGPRLGAATTRTPTSSRDLQSRGAIFIIGAAPTARPKSSRKSRTLIPADLLPATGSQRVDRSLSDTMGLAPGTPDGSRARFPFESALQLPSRDFNETLGKVGRLVGATRLQGSMASDNATPAHPRLLSDLDQRAREVQKSVETYARDAAALGQQFFLSPEVGRDRIRRTRALMIEIPASRSRQLLLTRGEPGLSYAP